MTEGVQNQADETRAGSLCRLSSEDAARLLIQDPDWGGRPTLTCEQQNELLALIKPRVEADSATRFRWYVNLIFAAAVERYCTFGGVSPRLMLRDEVEAAMQHMCDSAAKQELSPVVQEVVEAALQEKMPAEVRLGGSFSSWFHGLPLETRRRAQLEALKNVQVEVKKGPNNVIDRLMVRGLAALVRDVTGVVPRRTFRHPNKKDGPTGEAYWFLDLANRLAVFVNDALPMRLRRPGVASLTGIVAEELKRLRQESACSSA